ncbi:MAG TPA: alpha/beta fold hydrolase [Polyangia bacterium]|nr:alpha/beta fold hydrolase [Polyangia bacterium]
MNKLPAIPLRPSRSETFPYREQVFFYGDVPVAYFDGGVPAAPNGETLVFVHGLGANLTHFEYVAPPLAADGYRVCGLDLPGFGLSGKPHREYTIRYLSDAILRLMDHLGIERATLAGHSLGGLVVSDAALRAPQRVERLVLISSAGLFRMPLPIRMAARTIMRPGLLATALERNARRLLDLVFSERNERTERFIEQSVTRPDSRFCLDLARVMCAASRDLTSYHLLRDVERIKMPTLVIWGGRDRLLPFKPVPVWTQRLPDGELEVIERCGHMPIIEDPERVVTRMRAFLGRSAQVRRAVASRAS